MSQIVAVTIVLFFQFLAGVQAESGEYWPATCINVVDGDTIDVNDFHGHTFRLSLAEVDCPKGGQAYGDEARTFTEKMVLGKDIRFSPVELDKHGRTVAWVSVDGKSLNRELVRSGHAWWYRKYEPKNEQLKSLEAEARKEKRGLWRQKNPVPPWKWHEKSRHQPDSSRQ